MYDTILVPLDGSKRAERILPHVEQLARRYNARLVLLQVVQDFPIIAGPGMAAYSELAGQAVDQLTEEAEAYLDSLATELRENGIEAAARVVNGPVVGEILEAADREGADVIAMASHGRTGVSRVFYGSVAAGVLHSVDRPLLLVRSRDDG
jgi:nucleotide-binding universal stress UspA family protein